MDSNLSSFNKSMDDVVKLKSQFQAEYQKDDSNGIKIIESMREIHGRSTVELYEFIKQNPKSFIMISCLSSYLCEINDCIRECEKEFYSHHAQKAPSTSTSCDYPKVSKDLRGGANDVDLISIDMPRTEEYAQKQTGGADAEEEKVTFINFWADWCSISREFKPVWDKFKVIMKNNRLFKFLDVNVARNKKLQKECDDAGVDGFPCVMVFYKGKKYKLYPGKMTLIELKETFKNFLQKQGINI